MKPLLFLLMLEFAMTGTVMAEDLLGRLFYSPEERAALDANRGTSLTTPAALGQALRLDGVVHGRSHTRWIWVNGRMQEVSRTPSGDSPPSAKVATQTGPVALRVGEFADMASGERYRSLPSDAIKIHARKIP